MKRTLLLAAALFSVAMAKACPPPTGHAYLKIGATYSYGFEEKINTLDNLGVNYALGYETSNRIFTFGADGTYMPKTDVWSLGGEFGITPMHAGSNSPIIVRLTLGCGYVSTNKIYSNVGLELTFGHNTSYLVPFINAKVGMITNTNEFDPAFGVNANIGFRVWLGKGW